MQTWQICREEQCVLVVLLSAAGLLSAQSSWV